MKKRAVASPIAFLLVGKGNPIGLFFLNKSLMERETVSPFFEPQMKVDGEGRKGDRSFFNRR
jgi:hypothetical protein